MTQIFRVLDDWKTYRKSLDLNHQSLGFVPTMGNLHVGHQSLLTRSVQENTFTVLSIFVNPTQFNNFEDLKNYPNTLKQDIELAREMGVDAILIPEYSDLYPDNFAYQVHENYLSKILEGPHRPGHFVGMLTIVLKLFQLIKADRVYFGEKDYQQLELVRGMVQAFFIDTEIVACPTIRDQNQLAYSSRNNRLTPDQLIFAAEFPHLLQQSELPVETVRAELMSRGFEVDYIEDIQNRRYGAVRFCGVRLIDNVRKA